MVREQKKQGQRRLPERGIRPYVLSFIAYLETKLGAECGPAGTHVVQSLTLCKLARLGTRLGVICAFLGATLLQIPQRPDIAKTWTINIGAAELTKLNPFQLDFASSYRYPGMLRCSSE